MTTEHAIIIWLYIAGAATTRQLLTALVVERGDLPSNKWVEPLAIILWPIFVPIVIIMAALP